jgi:hypothetical protein
VLRAGSHFPDRLCPLALAVAGERDRGIEVCRLIAEAVIEPEAMRLASPARHGPTAPIDSKIQMDLQQQKGSRRLYRVGRTPSHTWGLRVIPPSQDRSPCPFCTKFSLDTYSFLPSGPPALVSARLRVDKARATAIDLAMPFLPRRRPIELRPQSTFRARRFHLTGFHQPVGDRGLRAASTNSWLTIAIRSLATGRLVEFQIVTAA